MTLAAEIVRRTGGVLLALSGLWGLRWLFARRLIRHSARLPIGHGGLVRGAEPIRLDTLGAKTAVLLLHGFGDTPQTLSYVTAELHRQGHTVYAPLLPGHGRTVYQFAESDGEQWLAEANAALLDLTGRYDRVGIVGLSMGGALAIQLAARAPDVRALVLVAPYCDAPKYVRDIARHRILLSTFIPYVDGRSERSILDPHERSRSLGYGVATPHLLGELVGVADAARAVLPSVRMPTLILQSKADNRIAPEVAETVLRELGSSEKRLDWVSDGGHIITVDRGRERVIAAIVEWLDRWLTPAPVR